jgi:phage I-like protein
MATATKFFFADIPLGAADGDAKTAPTSFLLFKWGTNATVNGDFVFDEEAAKSVMDAYNARPNIQLTADYEHQSVWHLLNGGPPIKAPNSCKAFKIRTTPEGLEVYDALWTDEARDEIETGKYRYFSPAVVYDEATGRVKRLINFGLTNRPAMDEIEPLLAASRLDMEDAMTIEELKQQLAEKDAEITRLKAREGQEATAALSATLGLDASASAGQRVTAATALATLRADVLAVTGTKTHADAIGTIRAWKDAADRVEALTAREREREEKAMGLELDAILRKGSDDLKVAPAEEEGLRALAAPGGKLTREGLAMLSAYIAKKPPVAAGRKDAPRTSETSAPSLSDADAKWARRFNVPIKELGEFVAKEGL